MYYNKTEVCMKKNFVILSLIATMALPAGAELTVNDTVSTDYLKHHEHSDSTVYAAQKLRAMANGETYKEEPAETVCPGSTVLVETIPSTFEVISVFLRLSFAISTWA